MVRFFADLAGESAEDFAGSDFDEVRDAFREKSSDGLHPLHGAGDLADECFARLLAGGGRLGVNVLDDWELRVVELELTQVLGEAVLRGLHERAMEGRADGKHDGALGAFGFREVGGALDSRRFAGDHDL